MSERRKPTRREDARAPFGAFVAAFTFGVAVALTALIVYLYVWLPSQRLGTTAPIAYLGVTGTVQDGGDIRVYVVTDTDTGKQYLLSDRGGICERVMPDGQ